MTRPAPRARRRLRLRRFVVGVLLLAIVGGTLGTFLVATDTFGAGERWQSVLTRVDRFFAGPPPDRPTLGTVRVTEPPETPPPTPTPVPVTPAPGATPTPTPVPTPTPTPKPKRVAMDVDIVANPKAVFASQAHKDWCAPAGVQMVLAVLGLVGTSEGQQREIAERVRGGSRTATATTATGVPRRWPSRSRPTVRRATRFGPSRRAAAPCGTRRSRSRRRARRSSCSRGAAPIPG